MAETADRVAPLPIVQYWHGSEPPTEVTELIASFRTHNPELPHLLFDRAGAEEFIAERFSERELGAFRTCAVPAMQADYFRYCAVLALGGIYADVGFRCLRPLQGLVKESADAQLFKRPRGHLINGLFIFKLPGHPLLRLALDIATTNIEQRIMEQVWAVTGPGIFTGLHIHCQQGLDIEKLGRDGRHARLAKAFKGVSIAPLQTTANWLGGPERPLQYKQGETQWVKWQERGETIFR
jgi:mannosyltransferase OCH1-like enzyme